MDEFIPNSEEESIWVKNYNKLSTYIANKLKTIPKETRLKALKEASPTDL